MSDEDLLRAEATAKRLDWTEGRSLYYNWKRYVGPQVRGLWHTLSDDQKTAIASDALARAREEEYD